MKFVLSRSAASVEADGVQFALVTTCAKGKTAHDINLQFTRSGGLDRKTSTLS